MPVLVRVSLGRAVVTTGRPLRGPGAGRLVPGRVSAAVCQPAAPFCPPARLCPPPVAGPRRSALPGCRQVPSLDDVVVASPTVSLPDCTSVSTLRSAVSASCRHRPAGQCRFPAPPSSVSCPLPPTACFAALAGQRVPVTATARDVLDVRLDVVDSPPRRVLPVFSEMRDRVLVRSLYTRRHPLAARSTRSTRCPRQDVFPSPPVSVSSPMPPVVWSGRRPAEHLSSPGSP